MLNGVKKLTWTMVGAITSMLAIASGLLVILNSRLPDSILAGLVGTIIAVAGNSVASIIGTFRNDKLKNELENGLISNKVREAINHPDES